MASHDIIPLFDEFKLLATMDDKSLGSPGAGTQKVRIKSSGVVSRAIVPKEDLVPVKLTKATGRIPIPMKYTSQSATERDYSALRPHHYPGIDERVKGQLNEFPQSLKQMMTSRTEAAGHGAPVPKYVASTFIDTINAPTRNHSHIKPPERVSIPRPYVVPFAHQFAGQPLAVQRSQSGKIQGSYSKRYADPENVPYLPPDNPVGPLNPVKQLTSVWSACWDSEAGAVYYYNNESGEATWIKPSELM
jgi:WW domain